MKPPAFEYRRPGSVAETLAELAEHGSDASLLAGGQSLIPLLNLRLSRPDVVVDINRVPGLDAITVDTTMVAVGALVRARDLERHAESVRVNPVISAALAHVAHPQIRNRTTIGGNVSHADPSSELPAVLAALDGRVRLTSASGVREIGWDEYFVTIFTTAKQPHEMLTEVLFPIHPGWRFSFAEIARRQGDYPLTGLCAGVRVVDGAIAEARLAAIAVADRPVRLTASESALVGVAVDDAGTIKAAAREASVGWEPMADLHGSSEYRRSLVSTLTSRTITSLVGAAA